MGIKKYKRRGRGLYKVDGDLVMNAFRCVRSSVLLGSDEDHCLLIGYRREIS